MSRRKPLQLDLVDLYDNAGHPRGSSRNTRGPSGTLTDGPVATIQEIRDAFDNARKDPKWATRPSNDVPSTKQKAPANSAGKPNARKPRT